MERLTIRNNDGSVSQPTDMRLADALEKLADYEDKEETGRLMILPVRIGDKIYRIEKGGGVRILASHVVEKIEIGASGVWLCFGWKSGGYEIVSTSSLGGEDPGKAPIWRISESVIHADKADGSAENLVNRWAEWTCPECGWFVGEQYIPRRHNQRKCNYCSRCGQKINWDHAFIPEVL